jgi:ribonucleotide reductase alpha subunit/intein/homing endonuclease
MTKALEKKAVQPIVPAPEYFFDEHAQAIAKRQYMQPSDGDVFGMFKRIADWVSSAEKSPELKAKWGARFYDLMASKHFCPGGRVLAGAGTQHGNVLNCFVQGATENEPSSFEGVMEVAKKLALVTKVGGGNGVNLDVYTARTAAARKDAGIRGWAYMSSTHADVEDFVRGLMRPPTQPDGAKQPTTVRNWSKVVYGIATPELSRLCRDHGVTVVAELPANVQVIKDDMGGIVDAAREVCELARKGTEPRIDLTSMRAEGAPIKGSGGTSSGPVSFLFEIFDNFLEWANLGAETSGPINTLRYCYSPVLRVVRQGGCLHPDTLVNTSRGTLRLRELVDQFSYGHQKHQLQIATDEGWKDSLEGFNNGIASTLKITLENGFELQGTPNHKLKVMRADGQRDWVRFDELQAEDYVIQVLDQHTGSPVSLEPISNQHFNATPITTPETLNEDLAFFLGYFWGDGFSSTGGRIGLCAAHGSVMMQRVPEMFANLFGLEVSLQQKPNDKSAVFVVKSAALSNWLEQNGLLKGKAATLELPRAIRQAPRHILAAFLRGLFEADGGISEHYPYLSSASKQLVHDVAVMLGGLGIPARISTYAPREDRYSKNEHYRLRIETSHGLANFIERIGNIEGSRFETLKDHTPDQQRESGWPIPHANVLLEPIFNSLPAGRKNHPSPYTQTRKTLSRYMRGERQLTATGLARLQQNAQIAEALPEINLEEYYVPVRSIEQGERILTLDICVEENHTYLAGGIVSHNTRRGAGMATISIDHTDVLDFLTAKDLDREASEGDISTFNISILATDKFLETLDRDGLWAIQPLDVPGKYYSVKLEGEYKGGIPVLPVRDLDGAKAVPQFAGGVPAKWIWRQIAEHAWSTGEPGLIFNDRVNAMSAINNLGPKYQIKSTNPCFVAGTPVMTDNGIKSIETLVGQKVQVWTGTQWQRTEFKVTGHQQEVWELEFADGIRVQATPYHTFILDDGTRVQLRDLQAGQRLKSTTPKFELELAGANQRGQTTQGYTFETSLEGFLNEGFTITRVTPNVAIASEVYCCTVPGEHAFTLGFGLLVGNCGEIPLTVGEPCDLGAINLAAYVHDSSFDFAKFRADVRDCIRFLDDVLDVNKFALEDNRVASQDLRRLGLGVMGLADALIKMGLRYDRKDGREMIDQIMSAMREEGIAESQNLGLERGVYPVYERNQAKMPHAPRRNVAVLTVAPTGTTSMLMGVSSGIEPVFSPFMWRKIGSEYKALVAPLFQELLEQYPAHADYSKNGAWDWDKVSDALGGNHGSCVGLEFVPEAVQACFVCAHDIAPLDHVRMQGTVQEAFDREGFAANSLSKTINMPNSATVEEIEAAYTEAYKTGCKGITVYRDGSRQFQVLSVSKDEKKEETAEAAQPAIAASSVIPEQTSNEVERWHATAQFQPGKPILERPTRLTGVTDMVKLTDLTAGTKRTFLITTNSLEGKPVEVVVVSGRAGDEANADSEALGRVVSIALQYGVPADAIQKTLRGINGGLYGSYNGRLVASKADLIAVALESTTAQGTVKPAEQALLYTDMGGSPTYPAMAGAAPSADEAPLFAGLGKVEMKGEKCPSCSSPNLVREEGCLKCQSCGYSKCG